MKVYIVTKASQDGTFRVGDLIWISDNGDLFNSIAGGWLSADEWDEGMFECVQSDKFYVERIGRSECIRKYPK